ncbi:undecaprenyl-phosphate glucose phosphotransferase [Bradyrhizobium diazoefficiens]|uniref:Putative sugar transferase for the initiation of polysaccharide biosynthesis n=1 Tax=Bradyrhizobium diazoefficiens SEMIA 5080 TaxID=754504 RepID=A0A837CCW1_9BRAD|nr:undecaprenyl-phosphate glucose phosphotransferase [Bradyrhizobium diazoefficiens]APO51386.1 undecaprenyl-phosphate glucose phosphotransferase [Bradyrhizobium diazoefficiens]KGJ66781.1 putative sugar transferase for the initiation of polysaccharide biosynthesis [Bradyrhizobium diazoefficiens SEMIA 5080]KOY11655.1 exopolysaccharide production protein [Bradyrhizobium diazoefficiens]MCD9297777.1 undecaprenyl-phosphate glucose phosphotransferase [Bradyrhizobium diazoefficiens]MCD9811611.1 undeca
MSYVSFTNLPASTKRPAHSVDGGRAIEEGVGRSRLTALLVLAAGTEFLLVAGAAYFAAVVYHRAVFLGSPDSARYIPESLLISTLGLLVSIGLRQYSRILTQPRHVFLWSGASGVLLVFSFFISTIFVLKISEDYSRATVIAQAGSVLLTVLCTRAVWFSVLQPAIASGLIDARRVILIGDPGHCLQFSARAMGTGIRTIRSFDFPRARTDFSIPTRPGVVQALPDVRQLVVDCRPLRADDVVILISESDVGSALALASALSDLPVDVHVVPVGTIDLMAVSRIAQFGNMVTMRIFQSPLTPFNRAIKRGVDIAVAIAGLAVTSPLFVIVPLAIKLDSRGPVFFRQTRHGYNNEHIRVLKFRSMTVMEDGDNFKPVTRRDPRVTRLGRLLRRTNVDEIPQLFNVLAGDMSIVGPRPHATSQNESFGELISSFSRRHNVKPGITGWAQVNGYRGDVDTLEKMRRRVEHDLYYIDNWSLIFDLKIIVMTFFSRKAYWNAY